MRLFIRLTFQVTLILFIRRCDGFMFSGWLRSTTERNLLSSVGQYRYQSYANNDAAAAVAAGLNPRFESKKDTGKPNVESVAVVVTTPPHASSPPTDKDIIAAFNNQRTGISAPAPAKYDKPWNLFDAVVVHSIPSVVPPSPISYVAFPAQNLPYFYYRDGAGAKVQPVQQNIASFATTPPVPEKTKTVQVELNYKDDTVVEKIGENVVLNSKVASTAADSGESSTTASSVVTPGQQQNASPAVSDSTAKLNLQNRPIKLLGSNPLYTVPTNFTFTPQVYYAPPAPASDIQYVPWNPFLKSPLIAPFLYRNVQRAVSERSEILPSTSSSPSPPLQVTNNNKPQKPICENCQLLPAAFPNYPYVRIFDVNEKNVQRPCAHESVSNPSTPPPPPPTPNLKSSNLAYLFMPS
ncbi:uncharacterized protein LOC135834825 [Planococcus citri]|uniref:uncharacterized protein LOC135834825 n=1 Tax=Planococcus citri TaxID=170843 RepID=UPI0031F9EBB8